jgi:hypothetical protein
VHLKKTLLSVIFISLLVSCGKDKTAETTGYGETAQLFADFIDSIPRQTLPIHLSCGLPGGTPFVSDFEKYKMYIPKSVDRIFETIENGSNDYKLIIYGRTGDDIYPTLFSFDNKGQLKDSLNLMVTGCGAADDIQIPQAFAQIGNDLTIELTDTTRFIHIVEKSESASNYIVDSLKISKVIWRVAKDGRFVKQ